MSELKQPYLWEKSYPADIDWHAPITPQDVPALMENAAAKYGTRPAIDFMDRIYSYGEVAELVNRAAKGLQAQGLNKGDRIGLMLPNCPAMVISYYAVLKAGGTVVNFNPLYAEEEIRDQIEDSECDVLITLDMPLIYDKAAKMLGKTRLKKIVLASMAEQLPFPKSLLYRLLRRRDIAALPADGRHMSFKNLCANDGRSEAIDINPEEDIAVLQYTGGTTGRPKGAMLSHANLHANVQQAIHFFPETRFGEEVMMGVLPLFHVFAMTVVMNFSVHTGAKMILLPRFELETALKTIDKKRPTFFPAVPTIYIAINNHPGVDESPAGEPTGAEIWFEATSGVISEVTIASNTIQATIQPGGANIRIWGSPDAELESNRLIAITGNVLGSQQRGIELRHGRRITISGNTIYDSQDLSILMEDCSGFAIGANTFVWRSDEEAPTRDGLKFVRCSGGTLTGLQSEHLSYGTAAGGAGITLQQCHDITIGHCQVLDPEVRGIELHDCVRCTVSSNTIVDRRQPPRMLEAIRFTGTCRDNLVDGNMVGGARRMAIEVGEGDAVVRGNVEVGDER